MEEFPLKSEFGSLTRKRNAMRKEHFKLVRMSKNERKFKAWMADKDGNPVKTREECVYYKRNYLRPRAHWIKSIAEENIGGP